MNYEHEFEIFSSNINQAAYAFYYHIELQRQIQKDGLKHEKKRDGYFQYSKIFQGVSANAQFWNHYKYSSILTAIITVGRILDKPSTTHKIERLITAAESSDLFTRKSLRERKMKGSDNAHDWIDSFMNNTYELCAEDFKKIHDFVEHTRKKWESIKDLRNKVYAHQEVMDNLKKTAIFQKSTYAAFEDIIKRLLKIEHIFWEAFNNGKKPDFRFQNKRIHRYTKKDIQSLLNTLAANIPNNE